MSRLPTGINLVPATFTVIVPSLSRVIGTGVVITCGADSGKVIVTLDDGQVSPPMWNGPKLREWCFEHFVAPMINDRKE